MGQTDSDLWGSKFWDERTQRKIEVAKNMEGELPPLFGPEAIRDSSWISEFGFVIISSQGSIFEMF